MDSCGFIGFIGFMLCPLQKHLCCEGVQALSLFFGYALPFCAASETIAVETAAELKKIEGIAAQLKK